MLKKYLICFLVSMVPIVELRGAIPISQGMQLPLLQSYIICVIGNMLPVPVIYLFARRVLEWGADKKYIGKFFTFCLSVITAVKRDAFPLAESVKISYNL